MAGYVSQGFKHLIPIGKCPPQAIAAANLLSDSGELVDPRLNALLQHPHRIV